SYITFWSEGAIIWAVQGFFATASITFCDQASWQSRIAAKPVQGVLGFFAATYIWFAIPSTIGTTLGLAYLAKTADNNNTMLLDSGDVDQ
ncbi:urea-proton symporter DUR3, partial [Biomphalaria glabrata]